MRIVDQVYPGTSKSAPTWLVECPKCWTRYRLTCWQGHATKATQCAPCGNKARRKRVTA